LGRKDEEKEKKGAKETQRKEKVEEEGVKLIAKNTNYVV